MKDYNRNQTLIHTGELYGLSPKNDKFWKFKKGEYKNQFEHDVTAGPLCILHIILLIELLNLILNPYLDLPQNSCNFSTAS